MRAILRFEYGRLGNQLFQYAALRSLNPTALFLSGYEQLFRTFDGVQAVRIGWMHHKVMRRWDAILSSDSRLGRFVPKIAVGGHNEPILPLRNGPLLYCPQATFFENNENIDHALCLKFRPAVVGEVQAFLQRNNMQGAELLFVHVRGGDFYSWPSPQKPGVVPAEWFIVQTRKLLAKHHPNARVAIIGDDEEAKSKIAKEVHGVVSTMSYSADMYLMSICSAGVISASEFSWWGSAFAAVNHSERGPFIAPLYWLNHSDRFWGAGDWPRNSSHLTFVDVNDR